MGTSKSPVKKTPSKKPTKRPSKSSNSVPLQPPPSLPPIPFNLPLCIIDNGGWLIKYGLSTPPSTMPNCTARPPHHPGLLAGDQILQINNLSQLVFRPSLERGMMTDGSAQLATWNRVLQCCGGPPAILLLEPPFVPSVISENTDRILFREMGVKRVIKLVAGCAAAVRYLMEEGDGTECCCAVDSGYSFTHVVPTYCGGAVEHAIKRLDVGGKVLTNLLKEAVTYRQWNMMDEFHIVNDVKEQMCFVTDKFDQDMKYARLTRRGLRHFDREYLLPDFVNSFTGSVRLPAPLLRRKELEEEKERSARNIVSGDGNNTIQSTRKKRERTSTPAVKQTIDEDHQDSADNSNQDVDSDEESEQQRIQRLKQLREEERKRREAESMDRQALALSVERFAVPEVLFRPSDIGMDCGGIVEAIVESIDACDETLRAAMYHNVLLTGGNARMPGFKERVELELRKLAPVNYVVRVFLPEDPVSYAWEGARRLSNETGFQERYSVDKISWEAVRKAGKDQKQIWGNRIYNKLKDP